MDRHEIKIKRHSRRKHHIRKKISGNETRLRLCVSRTLNNIYAQIINDVEGKTLVSASTKDKETRELITPGMKKTEQGKIVGKAIAQKAMAANIKEVAFDRSGFLYHGRVKALANAAREAGLVF